MEKELIVFILGGLFSLIILLITCLIYYFEEKNKCKHIWKEQSRSKWTREYIYFDSSFDFIRVELHCKKCGDIKWVDSEN